LRSCRLQPAEQSLDHNDHNDLDDQLLSQNSRGAAGWHWTWGAVVLAAAPVNAAALLPGCAIRRLLLWRYLLVFRRP